MEKFLEALAQVRDHRGTKRRQNCSAEGFSETYSKVVMIWFCDFARSLKEHLCSSLGKGEQKQRVGKVMREGLGCSLILNIYCQGWGRGLPKILI